jgi:hypothetical protein
MAFSERVKSVAKHQSAHRCCVCHATFVEVHHILPQEHGGSDDLDNAAPLCANCHDLYGGNPDKRKSIRQMRDSWWKTIKERDRKIYRSTSLDDWVKIDHDQSHQNKLKSKSIALYHAVFEDEDFQTSAKILVELVRKAETSHPGLPRRLYLDIDGHRDPQGGFDHDMYELQTHFVLGFLSQWLASASFPLGAIEFNHAQRNDPPDMLSITENVGQKEINEAIDSGSQAIWVADRSRWIYLE